MMPSMVEPAMRSCDSSPLMSTADDTDNEQGADIIGSPMSQLFNDDITQYDSLVSAFM